MAKQERYRGEGTYRRWTTERNLTFETQSISDSIIIKFYGMRPDQGAAEGPTKSASNLVLLGCE